MGYRGAGTFEFLYENGEFYFIEMNTRIQVEHPVTELITGVDLVQQQILIAAGEVHAAPARHRLQGSCDRMPHQRRGSVPLRAQPRPHHQLAHPGGPGVRIDSHAFNGYFVPPNYDSMIAKVITYGDTRDQALARMRTALSEMVVEGISTNIPLHRELLQDARFIEGGTSIHYLENKLAQRP